VTLEARVGTIDWASASSSLDDQGWALLGPMLGPDECRALAGLYADDRLFRSRVVMAQHGFGRGEYRYFAYPLPESVARLRAALYPCLAPLANRWNERLGVEVRYPESHADFLRRCHEAGQRKPTPLLLEYGPGDYNCLHQDVYGEHVFPFQVAFLLAQPGEDFTGGELVLAEQRPRMQSRVDVVPWRRGDAVVFAVRHRPVSGRRRSHRVSLKHGVGTVRSGRRHTLGVIFHDAE
jgi:hypothetical protein